MQNPRATDPHYQCWRRRRTSCFFGLQSDESGSVCEKCASADGIILPLLPPLTIKTRSGDQAMRTGERAPSCTIESCISALECGGQGRNRSFIGC